MRAARARLGWTAELSPFVLLGIVAKEVRIEEAGLAVEVLAAVQPLRRWEKGSKV